LRAPAAWESTLLVSVTDEAERVLFLRANIYF
jgi:hypothetical protein